MTQAITVQHNGVTQFGADNVVQTGGVYNFTDTTPPPPPQGRLTSALVTWMTHAPFTQQTDVTQYKNCAGVIQAHQTPIDWPYVSGAQYKIPVPANHYIAFAINVPAQGMPITAHNIKNPNEVAGTCAWKVSISTAPGDFSASALKVVDNVPPSDNPAIWFRNGPGTGFFVGLNPGQTYYLNIVPVDNAHNQLVCIASQ